MVGGHIPHFGRVWVTKTSILAAFGLKNGQKNPPESGGIFGWDVFFQYKNVVISPVLAIFL